MLQLWLSIFLFTLQSYHTLSGLSIPKIGGKLTCSLYLFNQTSSSCVKKFIFWLSKQMNLAGINLRSERKAVRWLVL